ncbi:MAG: hypothetical protein EHM14_13865 [Methanothrix sp.]|nr:MAG: hypothetical protein EHM14_13865 [Methanothrix sp.]
MKNRFLIRMSLGAILTFVGVLLSMMGYNAGSIVIAGVTVIVLAFVIRWRTGDQPEHDERTAKIWARGVSCSWMVTIIFLAALLAGGYLGLFALPAQTTLEAVAWVMSLSAVVFLAYFKHKGDVEPA